MGIKTKFNPLGGRATDNIKYKVYAINGTTSESWIDLNTQFGLSKINPETTFAAYDQTAPSNFFVINGQLYYADANYSDTIACVDTNNRWTSICGLAQQTGSGGFGICDGYLYQLQINSGPTLLKTQIGSYSDWTQVSGANKTTASSYTGYSYPIALRQGKPYVIKNYTATEMTEEGSSATANFKCVKGMLNSGPSTTKQYQSEAFALGITTNNQLAYINPDTEKYTVIPTSSVPATVTDISSGFFCYWASGTTYPSTGTFAYFLYDNGKIGNIYYDGGYQINLNISVTPTGESAITTGFNAIDGMVSGGTSYFSSGASGKFYLLNNNNNLYYRSTVSNYGAGFEYAYMINSITDFKNTYRYHPNTQPCMQNYQNDSASTLYIQNGNLYIMQDINGTITTTQTNITNCIKVCSAFTSNTVGIVICEA